MSGRRRPAVEDTRIGRVRLRTPPRPFGIGPDDTFRARLRRPRLERSFINRTGRLAAKIREQVRCMRRSRKSRDRGPGATHQDA